MNPERVLVIKVRAMGDTLLATPAIRALRLGWPQARITAVVSPAGLPMLTRNPDVDEIRVYDKRRPGLIYHAGFMRGLRASRFDLAVALHASFRTALLARASGASRRVVHNHSGRNFFTTVPIRAKKESKSAIERDLDAVRALGLQTAGERLTFPLQPADADAARDFLRAQNIRKPFFVLMPGAGQERKRWTADAAAAFLRRMPAVLPAAWVLVAGPADQGLALAIRKRMPTPVFSGTIHEAAALLALSRGAVAMDSGPKHVAVAVNTPTLTLWTDEPEAEWHPYPPDRHAILKAATGRVADISAEAAAQAAVQHFKKYLEPPRHQGTK